MNATENEGKSFVVGRDHEEMGRWIFSLIPLGVAFVFYFIFLLPADIANKDILYVTGATAGFSGLQAYWVVRGWKRRELLTVILGVLGITVAFGLTWIMVCTDFTL